MRLIPANLVARAQEMLVGLRDRIRSEPDRRTLALETLKAEVAALEHRIETLAHKQSVLAVRLDGLA